MDDLTPPCSAPIIQGGGGGILRAPPRNLEVEQALLGAILMNNRAHERVSEFLRAEHFSDPANGRVYEAISRLIERGQIADTNTLKHLFERDEGLSQIGGVGYLARLAGAAVTVVNAEDYGRTIHDAFLRRQLIDLGEQVVNRAHGADLEQPATDQIEQAEQQLYSLAEAGAAEGGFKTFDRALKSAIVIAETAYRRQGGVVGVPTGFRDLDAKLGGLHKGDLVILAGRPAMGKTALATNMATSAALTRLQRGGGEGAAVGFFSLEMSSDQLATRMLAERCEIASDRIRRGDVRETEFSRIVEASTELYRLPLFVDDTAGATVSAMRTRARRLKRTSGLGLIVVDYLQLIQTPGPSRVDARVQELSAITRGLKQLAKDLGVPVLALSQLNRAVEQREDKRPQLADLRESGTIEQDADVVMFIYREEYYHERREPTPGEGESNSDFNDRYDAWRAHADAVHGRAEIIIAKQRHGPTGTIHLQFDGALTRFSDLADAARLPEQRS